MSVSRFKSLSISSPPAVNMLYSLATGLLVVEALHLLSLSTNFSELNQLMDPQPGAALLL